MSSFSLMRIFPENPCNFAVEFIHRLRNHPDIIQIPSSRQVLSIPRLTLGRYYRKGKISSKDFIEIATFSSVPANQTLARKVAFEVLFPNYNKDISSTFFSNRISPFELNARQLIENEVNLELNEDMICREV